MPKIVNPGGQEIALSAYQKNELYRKAKELREQIKESRLTKDEHWNPTDHNIKKFQEREGAPQMAKTVQKFRDSMKAIGADPDDLKVPDYRGQR